MDIPPHDPHTETSARQLSDPDSTPLSSFRSCPNGTLHPILSVFRRASETCRALSIENARRIEMDKNRVAGSAKEVKGAVKERSARRQAIPIAGQRKARQGEGKFQNAIGGVNDAVRDALKK
jgi:uncharacterized protein YjbJ (UPF0337 family)